MLGAIVERLTGPNYFDYVRQRIFHPLGMASTDSYALDDVVPKLAVGYARYEVQEVGGKQVRGHGGGGPGSGINSELGWFLDGSYVVIVVGNYDLPGPRPCTRRSSGSWQRSNSGGDERSLRIASRRAARPHLVGPGKAKCDR